MGPTYPDAETKLGRSYVETVAEAARDPVILVGGWGVYFTVTSSYVRCLAEITHSAGTSISAFTSIRAGALNRSENPALPGRSARSSVTCRPLRPAYR